MNGITHITRRVFQHIQHIQPRPLGRWGVEKTAIQQEYVSNWASADHCGVCNDHLTEITKSLTPGWVVTSTNEPLHNK